MEDMTGRIRVLIKRPGFLPRMEYIHNTLEELQRIVGGYIETVTLAADLTVICNEEGRLHGLPYNCGFCGVDFVGTILLAGVSGDELCSLPFDLAKIRRVLPQLFEDGEEDEPCSSD